MKSLLNCLIFLFTLISGIIYYILNFHFNHTYYIEGLVFFIPIILLFILKYLLCKREANKKIVFLLTLLIVIIYFIGSIIGLFLFIVEDETRPTIKYSIISINKDADCLLEEFI